MVEAADLLARGQRCHQLTGDTGVGGETDTIGARQSRPFVRQLVLRRALLDVSRDHLAAELDRALEEAGLRPNIMVDCSHSNSNKDPALQPLVAENVANQILEGNTSIIGLMIESNLHAGRQEIPEDLSSLQYGVSVTDPCIDWATTETTIDHLHRMMQRAGR